MQVYLAESYLVYDGSRLQDMLTADDTSQAATSSIYEQTYGFADNAAGADECPEHDAAAGSTSDEYGHELHGAVGNTPVRAQGPGLPASVGAGDGSSGTPLSHGSGLSSAAPLVDSLQLSGESSRDRIRSRPYLLFLKMKVKPHVWTLWSAFEAADAEHNVKIECDFESKICALHVDATFDAFQKEVGSLHTAKGQMPHSAS